MVVPQPIPASTTPVTRESEASRDRIAAAVRLILLPGETPTYSRIVESISEDGGALDRTVSLMLKLPVERRRKPGSPHVFPLLYVRRDRRFHSLDLSCADGSQIVLLPREESVRNAQGVLAAEWQQVRTSTLGWHLDRRLPTMEQRLLAIPFLPMSEAVHLGEQLVTELGEALGDPRYFARPRSIGRRLAKAIGFFASRYIVWAQMEGTKAEFVTVKYSYRQTYLPSLRTTTARLRERFALNPYYLAVPIPLVEHARSYHAITDAPPGMYVARQSFTYPDKSSSPADWVELLQRSAGAHRTEPISEADNYRARSAEAGRQYSGEDECGTSHGHLYVYAPPGSHSTGPENATLLRVTYHDVPPGSFGSGLWVFAALVVFLSAISANWDVLVSDEQDRAGLVALLLALPGLGAAIAGVRADSREFRRSPLTARGALVLGGLVSLTGAATVLLAGLDVDAFTGAETIQAIGDQRTLLVLLCLSLTVLLFLIIKRVEVQQTYVAARTRNREHFEAGRVNHLTRTLR